MLGLQAAGKSSTWRWNTYLKSEQIFVEPGTTKLRKPFWHRKPVVTGFIENCENQKNVNFNFGIKFKF
jgi:hypothetical protein